MFLLQLPPYIVQDDIQRLFHCTTAVSFIHYRILVSIIDFNNKYDERYYLKNMNKLIINSSVEQVVERTGAFIYLCTYLYYFKGKITFYLLIEIHTYYTLHIYVYIHIHV